MSTASYVHCIYSSALQTRFFHGSKQYGPWVHIACNLDCLYIAYYIFSSAKVSIVNRNHDLIIASSNRLKRMLEDIRVRVIEFLLIFVSKYSFGLPRSLLFNLYNHRGLTQSQCGVILYESCQ